MNFEDDKAYFAELRSQWVDEEPPHVRVNLYAQTPSLLSRVLPWFSAAMSGATLLCVFLLVNSQFSQHDDSRYTREIMQLRKDVDEKLVGYAATQTRYLEQQMDFLQQQQRRLSQELYVRSNAVTRSEHEKELRELMTYWIKIREHDLKILNDFARYQYSDQRGDRPRSRHSSAYSSPRSSTRSH